VTKDLVTNDRVAAETALFLRAIRRDDEPVYREAQCEECDGTGYERCRLCHGEGTVDCMDCERGHGHDRNCDECNGSGSGAKCGVCHGSGAVADGEPWEGHPADVWTLAALRRMRL
jgi:hypothetical protein